MSNFEQIWQRLYEKREPPVPLRLADFADLEISSDQLGGYIQGLLDQGYVVGHVHIGDDKTVDDVSACLTEKGIAEYLEKQRI